MMRWLDALVLTWCGCMLEVGCVVYCAQRRDISPCSCRMQERGLTMQIMLACEKMPSYSRVAYALKGRFTPGTPVTLAVTHSDVSDIAMHPLAELGLTITNLQLKFDNISEIDDRAFYGLESVIYLSFADNILPDVPKYVLRHMPNIKTLDLSRSRIRVLNSHDFEDIPYMQHLVFAGNGLRRIEKGALPEILRHLHIGFNHLSTLNKTLVHLDRLEWLFINSNNLTSVDNELPMNANKLTLIHAANNFLERLPQDLRNMPMLESNANKLTLIHAANNFLERLPQDLRNMPMLESVYFYDNNIRTLDCALQKSRRLQSLNLSFNSITHLFHDDFAEADKLELMDLGYNRISTLNGALTPLRSLKYLNMTHNEMVEFSLKEIKGLKRFWVIDLSHNKIERLTGHTENLVESETRVQELRLNHNQLTTLGGTLNGLHGLLKLNISHNKLDVISPNAFIGLDELKFLDVSHNRLTTLDELSKTYLPALDELLASHNRFTVLNKDFHGLPVLCLADLSYNQISAINYDLVTKTKCMIHGVTGILKIHLHDNPIVCDETFPDMSMVIEKLHSRLLGECHRKTTHLISPQAPPMNDVMPRDPTISVVPLEKQGRLFHELVGHVIPGRSGELPILVEPPITLPTPTNGPTQQGIHYMEPRVIETVPESLHSAYVQDLS